MVTIITTKCHSRISDVSNCTSIKFLVRIRSTDGNIRDWLLLHLSFLTSHNRLFISLCKTSKKTTFSVFLSFFLVKLSKSRLRFHVKTSKLNISSTPWPILMTLVSSCRILGGLSDEINLFWLYSSPLNDRLSYLNPS